ncbi:MAG: RIP metalloprotease RseP, partial [Pseudomonadales bacterium]|nr:RIP metalloprotease RseP [Pseudomonadales bacterium]
MNIIQIVLATLVTLGILVTIHEYGHFWVARRCGVKVLRFSVGFGRALYSWRDRHGTEFVLAAIPLGGYVKMLDEREGDVAPEDAKYAFNRQSVGKRIAVVVAGPLANFLFAIVAYWLLFVVGVNTVVPVIGDVKPDSMAARAGLQKGQEITAVGDVRTTTWQAINIQLLGYIGDSGELLLTTRALNGEIEQRSTLLLDNWLRGVEQPDPLEDMGVKPYVPPIPPIVGQVLEQSAGERAGLKAQDKITTLDGDAIDEWQTFVAKIKAHPQQPVLLGVERDNQSLLITVTPDAKQLETGEVVGYLGVGAKAFEWP